MKRFLMTAIAVMFATPVLALDINGALDDYNATYLNTPEAKAALIEEVCSSDAPGAFFLCQDMIANGAPTSDIRVAIAAAATIAGGVTGGATALDASTTLFGWTPNVLEGILLGGTLGNLGANVALSR